MKPTIRAMLVGNRHAVKEFKQEWKMINQCILGDEIALIPPPTGLLPYPSEERPRVMILGVFIIVGQGCE